MDPGPQSLPRMEVAPRIDRVRRSLLGTGCEAMIVSDLINIRWLTGFTGSRGLLVIAPTCATLITDARYQQQAAQELNAADVDVEVVITRDEGGAVTSIASGVARVGLEADEITWSRQRQIDEQWLPECEIVPTSGVVAGLRRNKDGGEVSRIEAAAAITDEAVSQVLPMLTIGCTERELALELDSTMRRLGATGPAFETIVAGGPNGSLPHARPTDRRVEADDLVIVDVGAVVDGYHSDMTRTTCAGEPDDFRRGIWQTVIAAQAAGVAAVAPGIAANAVDAACREVIDEAGWGENFIHGTGHGVGLQIHEEPWLGAATEGALVEGDVITVEPGIYIPGRVGVRIEDTVVVTADGCRPLTGTVKQLQL
jgi:Xaa-Pro aminopeptidase